MATNLALKRAKKAQKRKLHVAEKRRAEALEASLPVRILRASRAPIQHCLLTDSLFGIGTGVVVLARGATSYDIGYGSFLVDVYCLGIKNVMFSSLDGETLDMALSAMHASSPMIPVDPSYARRLLLDLARWSQSIGFAPHQDFAAVERLFGDVSADASDAVFQFGSEGKPLYIPGPTESPAAVHRRIQHLRSALGDDGFVLEAPG